MYNWGYSLRIAMQFRRKYPRASEFFNIMYGTNIAYSAKLFQLHQKRWNKFKRCIIKLDWLLKRASYSPSLPQDVGLLKQKVRHMMSITDKTKERPTTKQMFSIDTVSKGVSS